MGIINMAIKRKKAILELLEKYNILNSQIGQCYESSIIPSSVQTTSQQYSWLLANLELTNQTLDKALLHTQVMYGKAISKR